MTNGRRVLFAGNTAITQRLLGTNSTFFQDYNRKLRENTENLFSRISQVVWGVSFTGRAHGQGEDFVSAGFRFAVRIKVPRYCLEEKKKKYKTLKLYWRRGRTTTPVLTKCPDPLTYLYRWRTCRIRINTYIYIYTVEYEIIFRARRRRMRRNADCGTAGESMHSWRAGTRGRRVLYEYLGCALLVSGGVTCGQIVIA